MVSHRQGSSPPPGDLGGKLTILFVCSGNPVFSPGDFDFAIDQAAVCEQMASLRRVGIEADTFFIQGHGIGGYLHNLGPLKEKISSGTYDLVHAHYGLAGMLAVCQRLAPVVITFQGTDINFPAYRLISTLAGRLAAWSIYVADGLHNRRPAPSVKSSVVPYGVDLWFFQPLDKATARAELGLDHNRTYVLFASSFTFPVKNARLAKSAISLTGNDVTLLELCGRSRREVCLLLNACDALLLTSRSEGSPQIVKEAMACNCPIVSTRVGDVPELIEGVAGCFLADNNPQDVADKLKLALAFSGRTNGRERMKTYSLEVIAQRVREVYAQVLRRSHRSGIRFSH
jgi:glycosyltransferase involved in cell wall biosynthesis